MTDINLVDNPSDTRFDVYQDIWLEIYIEHEEYDANDYPVDITGMAYARILICVAVDVDFASAQAIIERTLK